MSHVRIDGCRTATKLDVSLPEKGNSRKVDVRLPGKRDSNSHDARPVHLIIIDSDQWVVNKELCFSAGQRE